MENKKLSFQFHTQPNRHTFLLANKRPVDSHMSYLPPTKNSIIKQARPLKVSDLPSFSLPHPTKINPE